MLYAELTRPFDNKDWLFEPSFGGLRTISAVSPQDVYLFADKHTLLNHYFPRIVQELNNLSVNAVFDGEMVVFNEYGKADQEKSANLLLNTHFKVVYYISDILSLNDQPLTKTPLTHRKKLINSIIGNKSNSIKSSDFVIENGCDLFETISKEKYEGMIAKKLDSFYHPGKRTSDWLKIKNKLVQEIYICGFTKSIENNKLIGSIIAGTKREDGQLQYSGLVNVGLDNLYFQEIYSQLVSLTTEVSPFKKDLKLNQNVIWVKPVLKCEVKNLELSKEYAINKLEYSY